MKKFSILFIFLCCLCINKIYSQATQANVTGTETTNVITNNVASVVDNGLTITANGSITGFIITITGSYTAGDDLSYSGTLPSGVTAAAFNATTRSLVFSGSTTIANWQALLRTVTLKTTSAVCNPESRAVSFIAGGKYYNNQNGHFYELYNTLGSWTGAKAYAEKQSYFGRVGYLATLTSQSENSFVSKLIGVDSWIGCSDDYPYVNAALGSTVYANQAAAEGKFYWVTGPEKGTQLTTSNGNGGRIATVYQNWDNNEPNNVGTENFGHLYAGRALWNDFADTKAIAAIVEYGGMPGDNTSSQVVFTRNMFINGAPSGTITGGNVSVCTGTNSTTLTLNGLAAGGTVAKWQYSLDDFLTAGVDVANTTTSITVSNINVTRYYRAIVNTSGCTGLSTSSTPIYVAAAVAGNIIADNNAICAGSNAAFTLFGNMGNVVKWQVSTSSTFASGVTDINNTTSYMSYRLSTTGTYYFRAVVQISGCGSAVNTPGYAITVTNGSSAVGGAVSNAEFCGGSNSGTLTLSGSSGTVQKWQFSTDGGIIWTDVANTTTSLSFTNISANRIYRAVLASGACGVALSTPGTITVFGTTVARWDGGTNNSWATASNWCGGVPAPGMDIVISATAANNLVCDQNRTVGTITFNGTNRSIVLGAHTLTAVSISGAGANGYVITNGTGRLKMNINKGISKIFPVGDSSYNPVQVTNNSNSADEFSINVLNEMYGNGINGRNIISPRVKRTWDITKATANSGSGIDIIFNWNNGEALDITEPALYHHEAGVWKKQTGTTTFTANSLTYKGYTGTFSPFAVADAYQALPVRWLSFTAQSRQAGVLLKWSTASEQNTKDFMVQHSANGNNWDNIGTITAVGNSHSVSNYSYVHTLPFNGKNYYRIRQTDLDGKSTLSEVRVLTFASANPSFLVEGNPVNNGVLKVQVNSPGFFSLYNINGGLLWKRQLGAGLQRIDVSGHVKGSYLLSDKKTTEKIIIQ